MTDQSAELTDEQIDAELKAAGIDMEPAYRKLRSMVDKARAAELTKLREQVAHQTACIDAQSETCARYATRITSIAEAAERLSTLCYRLEKETGDEDWGNSAIEFQTFAAEAIQEKPCKCVKCEEVVALLRRAYAGDSLYRDVRDWLADYDAEQQKAQEK